MLRKLSDTDYVICTPDRRKKSRVCHINMLKAYHVRENIPPVAVLTCTTVTDTPDDEDCRVITRHTY